MDCVFQQRLRLGFVLLLSLLLVTACSPTGATLQTGQANWGEVYSAPVTAQVNPLGPTAGIF